MFVLTVGLFFRFSCIVNFFARNAYSTASLNGPKILGRARPIKLGAGPARPYFLTEISGLLTTNRHEVSRGLSATAEFPVSNDNN